MGSNNSKQVFTTYDDAFNIEEYTQIQQCFVNSLGEIHELTNSRTRDKIFLKLIKIEQQIIPKDIEDINNKLRIVHPHLLQTYASSFSQKQSKEEIRCEINIYFEAPIRSLYDEIFDRRQTQNRFPALELLVYLKNCIDVFATLEERGCVYENITPRVIYFSIKNQMKVIHPLILSLMDFSEVIQLEPDTEIKQLMCLEIQKRIGSSPKAIKSSVFTLGVSFLASALLEEENMLYQSHEDPQPEKFKSYNNQLRNSYPPDFVNVLRHMLDDDESKRPSFIQLRDNLVEYMKAGDSYDNEFPLSPTLPPGKKKRVMQFSESFPSKFYKSSFSNSNTLGSPELANSRDPPEWSFKSNNNRKSFFDRIFCGMCTNNADEETEIKALPPSRPSKKKEIADMLKDIEKPRESLQFNSEAFEGLVKETTQQNPKTIPTMLTTDRNENTARSAADEDMPQVKLDMQGHEKDSGIQIIEYNKKVAMNRYEPGMQTVRFENENNDINKKPERQRKAGYSGDFMQVKESPKKAGILINNGDSNRKVMGQGDTIKVREILMEAEQDPGYQTNIKKGKNQNTQSLMFRDVNTTKMTVNNSMEHKSMIQNLNKKKKSALVKQIINDYKKNANSQTKYQNEAPRNPLEERKTNTFSRFLESHEKPLHSPNRSMYEDFFGSGEKAKTQTLTYRETQDMRRRNNEDGEGIFIRPEDSAYGMEVQNRSRNQNRKSFIASNMSSPYRDGNASYRSAGMVVTRNECPSCYAPFMSINKSFTYSVPGHQMNNEEREEIEKMTTLRTGSVKWNLGNESNSGNKKYSSPAKKTQRDSAGYQIIVTPSRQENTAQKMEMSPV